MKHLVAAASILLLPYASLIPLSPGNPDGEPYAGQAGSVWDAAANPAQTVGVVEYNPLAPLPTQSGTRIQPIPVTSR